jgi:hypothetical protein
MLKKSLLLVLTALAALSSAAYAERTFTRRYVDRHCRTHLQDVRVYDNGDEEIMNDVIISTATDCDGQDD